MTFTKLVAITAIVLLGILATLCTFQRSFFYPAPTIALDQPPPGFRLIETQTSDGLTLRAAFRAPLAGKPTLLFFPGNADTAEGAAYATRGPVAAGYGALLVIYRGYSGNPGSRSEQGLYADGNAAMAWLGGSVFAMNRSLSLATASALALRPKWQCAMVLRA